ncbi:MAG: O-antigen ligase family protein [Candidatus Xenobiia bacterium LiM19]
MLLGTVLSLLLLCYLAYPQRIASYFFHRGSDTGRVIIYQKSFAIMKDHMWLGVGAGNFRIAFPRYCTNEEYGIVASPPPWHAHSVPLNLAAETGIISALAWCAFLFLIISGLVRALRRQSPDRVYIAGLLTGIMAFTFFSLIDCSLNDHRCGFTFFLIAGLAAGYLCAVGEQGGTGEYNH